MNKEIWKDVVIDNLWTDYEVSDKGNVRIKSTGEPVTIHLSDKGYCRVYLRRAHVSPEIKNTGYLIHRLVLMAFDPIDNPDEMTGDHINKDKLNNTLENLRWLTRKENSEESHRFGRVYLKGEQSNHHIFTTDQIIAVCELLEEDMMTMPEISKCTGVALHTVQKIKSGKQWTNISCDFNIPETIPNTDIREYTEDNKKEVLDMLRLDKNMLTRDIMDNISLPKTNATRMYINRIRNKYNAELDMVMSSTTKFILDNHEDRNIEMNQMVQVV